MTRYFCILVSIVLLPFISSGEGLAMEGIVVKVIDGDSIKVLVDGIVKEVRLYGIDTPEYRQPYSNKAKQLTKRLADKQLVTIVTKDIDRYGRTVGIVFSRGKMVNRELVREGLAWFYQRYCLEHPLCGELKRLEAEARALQRGLWKDNNPVAPWDWKHRKNSSRTPGWKSMVYRLLSWL